MVVSFAVCAHAQAKNINFEACLASIRNSTPFEAYSIFNNSITDNSGAPVGPHAWPDAASKAGNLCMDAGPDKPLCFVIAVTYDQCQETCGSGREPFSWATFSQQFGNWLLPWLALLSQLPFGANDRLANLNSVSLTVGSPALAAYSLAITALNSHWVSERFASNHYPNVHDVVRTLVSLQQSPLHARAEDGLLASLIVLPENDCWWSELANWLDHSGTHTWSISAFANIAWVVLAVAFTVFNSVATATDVAIVNVNGQANGTLWLWLLPIVVGWLRITPKCDADRLTKAMDEANGEAWLATDEGPPALAMSLGSSRRGLSLNQHSHTALYKDQHASPPIYNYARIFSWTRTAEEIALAYDSASANHEAHQPVAHDGRRYQMPSKAIPWPPGNREGTRADVPGVWTRIVAASVLALRLQWDAPGSAILNIILTPTKGLGCRSGAYLLYGVIATVIWFLMVSSSVLVHVSSKPVKASASTPPRQYIATLAILLRRTGKTLAVANASFAVIICMFQFANFYSRCYCNSNVLGLGESRAYNVMDFTADDFASVRDAWTVSLAMGVGSVAFFLLAVWLYLNPRRPQP
ncbi:hypothetical protein K525DRAFT_282007 [Schizophyllum commune Loenen D]|nr:hypothetical protein K525DRAFT_282007 [Schizophyllum commune Loenen D]